jgi:hypothetical protein
VTESDREKVRVRVRLGRRRKHPLRRASLLGAAVLLFLVAVIGVWIAITGLKARSELNAARADLAAAKAAISQGDVALAKQRVLAAQGHTGAGQRRTNDVVWRVSAKVPFFGNGPKTVRGMAQAANTLARQTLPVALEADTGLDPAAVRPAPNQINLALLSNARAPLVRAASSAVGVRRAVAQLPHVSYLPPIAHARKEFKAQVDDLTNLLSDVSVGAQLAPSMLGQDKPRRYFLAFQTNAESRGTGGLVGAFAVVTAARGRIQVEEVSDDSKLVIPADFRFEPSRGYNQVYGEFLTTQFWGDTNVSPDFPEVAKIWLAVWKRTHPTRPIDGALATDPIALSYVLKAIGPVALASGERVTAENVVRLLEVDTYARFGNDPARHAFQTTVAETVLHEVLTRGSSARSLLTAFTQAVDERRLLVSSANTGEQALLSSTKLGGSVTQLRGPTAFLVVNNNGANKLDYYLRRSFAYTARGCSGDSRKSKVRITLTNTAPASGLPDIVTQSHRLPQGGGYPTGTNQLNVFLYTTEGASFTGGTINGQKLFLSADESYGHRLYTLNLFIKPGQTHEIVINLREPVVAGNADVPIQPLVVPMDVKVKVPSCGGNVD